VIGIIGVLKKHAILVTIFVAFILIEIIVEFDEGLIPTAIWSVITILLSITLIGLIHQNNLRERANQQTSDVHQLSQENNSGGPPDYYSVVFQPYKPPPPQYQTVELMPVQSYSYPNRMQRY
jgi:hypothetical protein